MIIGVIEQQPLERLDYDLDFTGAFDADDPLLTLVAAVTPPGELVVTTVVISPTIGKVWISGGVSGRSYKVTLTGYSSESRVKQDEVEVIIEDY